MSIDDVKDAADGRKQYTGGSRLYHKSNPAASATKAAKLKRIHVYCQRWKDGKLC